ncbi:MAG: hypothetical protein IT337_12470 [Thermomicrobiales bacterium]|nr:hypothetical protein [Thermomicrobiales bacterium]
MTLPVVAVDSEGWREQERRREAEERAERERARGPRRRVSLLDDGERT